MNDADSVSSDAQAQPVLTREIPPPIEMVTLLGPRDEFLRTLERQFPAVDTHVRGNEMTFTGPDRELDLVDELLDELLAIIQTGQPLNRDAVERSIGMLRGQTKERPADVLTTNIVSSRGRTIRPKTLGQKRYVDAIDEHTVVFGIGPAGTGKTYLAMAKAVAALQAKQVNRIILTRPAVEAGERLGFLPGTLNDKIDPYLRPLYDALHDMISPETIPRLMASGTIEVAPLAYMRGRAQPLDSQVLTPTGFRDFGSLQVGDLVVGSSGLPTPVIGVYPQGLKEVYRVTTQDGASTVCCGEHLWTVRTPDDRWRVVETKDMIGRLHEDGVRQFELPMVGPVEFAPRELPVEPYAAGRAFTGGLAPVTAGSDGRAPAATAVRPLVVDPYLYGSASARREFLHGMLDSLMPGWRDATDQPLRFPVPSQEVGEAIVWAVRSLGGSGSSSQDAVELVLPGAARHKVESIEPLGVQETMCIQVAAEDSLYATDDFLLTHNTLNDAFIILDEAQNTSGEQMKMFLTRLGFGSKMVVTGDVTQIDLPGGTRSGLNEVRHILEGIEDVHFTELTSVDVVRHRLVSEIVDAYDRNDAQLRRRRKHTDQEGRR